MLLPILLLHLLLLMSASLLALPSPTSCSSRTTSTQCSADRLCLWTTNCCHSTTVCTQDVATLSCSAGCRSCGLHGCFSANDECPTPCEGLAQDQCRKHTGPSPTGTRCVWDEQGSKGCMTVIPTSNSQLSFVSPHFAAANAGLIAKARQAGMITSLSLASTSAVGSGNPNGQFVVISPTLSAGPASVDANGGASSGSPLLPPSAVLPDANPDNNKDDAWGSAFRLNGTRVTTPVIAGIVIGCLAALGIVAVAARHVVKKRQTARAAALNSGALPNVSTPLAGVTSAPSVAHNRDSLLGWLQRVASDVPPLTPLAPPPAAVALAR